MIITITKAEQITGDYGEYIKVTGVNDKGKEVTKNVSDKFRDKWGLLQADKVVEFTMTSKKGKWYLDNINPVELPPETTPKLSPEMAQELNERRPQEVTPRTVAPQVIGKTGYKADPAKMSSIERQVAIKLACDISSDTETLEQIFSKADKIYEWISKA